MSDGLKIDVVLAALILSALGHFGVMYWAEPKVMTHVSSGEWRASRRAPMTVSRAETGHDPVALEMVKDLPAMKDAPVAEEVLPPVPALDGISPQHASSMPQPAIAARPQVLERLRPEFEAPVLPKAEVAAKTSVEALPSMPVEVFFSKPPLVASGGPAAGGASPAAVIAPAMALRHPAPAVRALEPLADEVSALPPAIREERRPSFKPLDEVMPAVDEKVVSAEKAAVRAMVNQVSAADLSSAVGVSFRSHAAADGFTYFKATVVPNGRLPVVAKDIVVLIDASGSIGNDRLASCRKAARQILRTCTNTGDRFNLVAFRDKFSYAFKSWRPCDAERFEAGDRWLGRLAAHGRTDVFATIASVLALPRDPARPLIALVVTDGVANEGVRGTEQIISKFSELNDGLVSVYMYGVKSAANRRLIDVLTRANRGESFIYDGWRWSAGAGIESLSERFRDPVLTDLRVVFTSACPAQAYPARLKNIYRGNSVEIIGRVPTGVKDVAFSLKGLSADVAYEGFFRQPLSSAVADPSLAEAWKAEASIARQIR